MNSISDETSKFTQAQKFISDIKAFLGNLKDYDGEIDLGIFGQL